MHIVDQASYWQSLGEIEPTWHQPEFDRPLRAELVFRSHNPDGEITYETESMAVPSHEASEEEQEAIVENLRSTIITIDQMIRDYRGYTEDTPTRIGTTYRVGRERASSAMAVLTGQLLKRLQLPVEYLPSGDPHFDEQDKEGEEDFDAILVNHRGAPTTIYEGPVRRPVFITPEDLEPDSPALRTGLKIIGEVLLAGRLASLSAPNAISAPADEAILINRQTLHKMSRQAYNSAQPPALLRVFVKPVTNE